MPDFTNLEKRLRALGIPIHGGSAGLKAVQAGRETDTVTRPDGVIVRVDFTDAATPQQRQQALNEAMAFDFTRTADDDLGEVSIPIKVLAAEIMAIRDIYQRLGVNPGTWWSQTLNAAYQRIQTLINGRNPSGTES